MEEPNNNDNDEDAFYAGFGAVGAAAAGANEDDDDDEEEEDDDDDDDEEEEEEEEEEDDHAYDEEEDRMAIQKLLSVVQQRDDFPVRQRNKIIELAHRFVNNLGADIKGMVTDQRCLDDGYAGLDNNRDTKKEVATALRHYPETLSERGGQYDDLFPIQCITLIVDRANRTLNCNPMAVSFVVLFAKLAIEFNSFADEERGGLLIEDGEVNNVLNRLVQSSHKSCNEDYHQLVDTQYLEVLVQLRRSSLFKKEDIQRYHLVHGLCQQTGHFDEERFQFLTNWDPSSLVQLNNDGDLPLHYAGATQTLGQFQVMIDGYFQYYTKEKVICLLFQKDDYCDTPFQFVCEFIHKHKTDTLVHDVVEQSLGTASFSSPTTTALSSSSSSLNIGTVLMMAARNDNISLDGWYYCVRRQPDTMLSMVQTRRRHRGDDLASVLLSSLSSSTLSNNNNTGTPNRITGISHGSNNNSNRNRNAVINDDGTSNNNRRRTTRKRKQRS